VKIRTAKIGIVNNRTAPHVVWIEPWANDYTLMPGEELEVIATGGDLQPRLVRDIQPDFNVVEHDGATQVYCENTADFKVMQGSRELPLGAQREPGLN
jgi:hypothetical protein